jgi:hypothetical protein
MKTKRLFIFAFILLSAGTLIFAQRPPKGGAEWFDRFDVNKNGSIEAEEYQTAADSFFKRLDRNNDGIIDDAERPKGPPPPPNGARQEQFPMPGANRPSPIPGDAPIPFPFFVMESIREPGVTTRAEFGENINEQFSLIDKNGDR